MFASDNSLASQNKKLTEANESLRCQLESLKMQFNSAIPTCSSIEDVFKENIRITKELRESEAENDDLSRRLQISLEKINELTQKLDRNQEKRLDFSNESIREPAKCDVCPKENDFDLKKEILEKEKIIFSLETSLNQCKNQLDQLYSAAGTYFMREISDFDSLLSVLLTPKIIREDPQLIKQAKTPSPHKNRKLKEQLTKEKMIRETTEAKLIQKIDAMSVAYNNKLNGKEEEIKALEEANNKLKQRNNALKKDKEDAMKEISRMNVQHRIKVQELEADRIEEQKENVQMINKLKEQLASEKEANDTVKKQLSCQIMKYKNVCKQLDEKNKEMNEMKIEAASKINSEKCIKERDSEQMKMKISQEVNQLKRTVNNQQNEIRKQSAEITQLSIEAKHAKSLLECTEQKNMLLSNENTSLASEVEKVNSEMQKKNNEIKANEAKIADLESQISILRKKINKPKEPIFTQPEQIPQTAWATDLFPHELSLLISNLSTNETLQTSTKIRHIMAMIHEWYDSKVNELENEMKKMKDDDCRCLGFRTEFAESMSVLFSDFDVDFGTIIKSEETRKKFAYQVISIKTENKELEKEKQKLKQQNEKLLSLLQVSTTIEAEQTINELHEEIALLNDKVNNVIDKKKMQKKERTTREAYLLEQIEKEKDENTSLQIKLNDAVDLATQLQKQNQKLKAQIEEIKEEHENTLNELTVIHEAKGKQYELTSMQSIDYLNQEKIKRRAAEEEVEELKKKIASLERENSCLTKKKHQKTKEIKALLEKVKQVEKAEKEKSTFKIESAVQQNNVLIDQMRDQINELKESTKEHVITIQELEASNKELQKKNADLCLQVQKSELSIANLKMNNEREKRIIESQTKTKIANAEAQCLSKIDELKLQFEEQKRKVFGYVAMQFCSLFDASSSIDDANFEVFVSNIRSKMDELLGMEARLRILLSLGPKQSIVDAVSMMLLHS